MKPATGTSGRMVTGWIGVLLFWSGAVATAASYRGVRIADTASAGLNTLILNGSGVRSETVLKVDIYAMALYLEATCADPDSIIASAGTKLVWQYYFRSIGVSMVRNGWRDNLASHNESLAGLETHVAQYLSSMESVKTGTVIAYEFVADSVIVAFDGKKKPAIVSRAFQTALLNVWLGPNVKQKAMKDAILGR